MMKTSSWLVLGVLLAAIISPAATWATEHGPLVGGATLTTSGVALGTSAVTIIPADGARQFLQIQNITAATNTMACTIDGSVPVINANGVQLAPSGAVITFDTFVPTGALKCIGSATSTAYTANYVP